MHAQNSKNSPSGPRVVADLALETSSSGRGGKGASPPRVSVKAASRSGGTSGVCPSSKLDVLWMTNIVPSLSYRALHSFLKPYGTVLRIRLIYERDCKSNRCYVTFDSSDEAQSAYNAVASLPVAGVGFKVELLRSSNIEDDDKDYVPNLFEDANVESAPRVRQIPPPHWFVAYYRNGRGNFIHAARYLAKEIGTIPEGNLKKYGKGVLVKAKDITQAIMLQHLPCPADSMFETVKAHHNFNYCKGCIYNHDLYEFSEEEILDMCPSSVHKVSKMKGSANMILLTFFGSTLPDSVRIGPLNLRVKTFVDRPLQCFSCYGYGHGKKYCNEPSRCGNCSVLDSHSTADCEANAYCFYCRDAHQLRSRQCPRYRLEQDILQFANSHFISLGSARRELLYRQRAGTGAMTYASSLRTRSSAQSATQMSSSTVSSRPSEAIVTTATSQNRFAILSGDSVESPPDSDGASPASSKVVHVVEVHAPHTTSPKHNRGLHKRQRSSLESVDLAHVPPSKVSAGVHDCGVSKDRSVGEVAETSIEPAATPSVPDPVASQDVVADQKMDTEESLRDSDGKPFREPIVLGSGVPAGSGSVVSGKSAGSLDKLNARPKAAVPRTRPLSEPVASPIQPSGLFSSRRITIASQVGKGKSPLGTRLKHGHK